ncbi:hypothetical protein PsAD13_00773 [Pseudovibrio sp. Ad13]|jgi:uncharacterized lipoprotein|uniref:hypothetical protein n=1 Tax=unclassified Pseudovibrio TaxID=2627060 RepID=UPI0007AE87E5|nr:MULTISPECIES: hypothetical protein [unclassified Pseudovibrio]KZK95720.1 hypothetical protein PsAD46_00735 [Pseudovibrio sp. Ad46]KZK99988.1 hypothetical protein PsW74_02604 [Pseudovibrio sp. W74]KZL11818.1 hypothetical protein PsAD14_00734 [Pseudovibrio sp. Ad14]KZK87495.1 hypothetical protein PsAD13_00773 [Pseudovibrio sp. Ad13]KZL16222.1 hypothetical protein PsAD37_04197 [Pseudovibrio sp. Ad37]
MKMKSAPLVLASIAMLSLLGACGSSEQSKRAFISFKAYGSCLKEIKPNAPQGFRADAGRSETFEFDIYRPKAKLSSRETAKMRACYNQRNK